jgi:hypothetical protein
LKVPNGSWKIAWMPSVNQTFSFLHLPSCRCGDLAVGGVLEAHDQCFAVVVLPQPLSPANVKISAGLM